MKRFAAFLFFLAIVVTMLSGCGHGADSVTRPTTSIDASQYRVLRRAHMQVGQLVFETDRAIQPPRMLAQSAAEVAAVRNIYASLLPASSLQAIGRVTGTEHKRLKDTLTLSLMDLNKAIVVKDKNGHVSEDAQAAWYPASSYLNAVDFVHGLGDFQRYLLQHTLDDGTRVNPADPPASMNRNEAKIFGNVATFAGVGVNITWDTGYRTHHIPPGRAQTTGV